MRVFVTGATGFIGSAIVEQLLRKGHEVLGLARNAQAADKLTRMGAGPHSGDLDDPAGMAVGADACDGVIHTAFGLDFSRYGELAEHDRRVVGAMAAAMAGTDRPLVATSVTTLLAPGRVGVESDEPMPGNPIGARAATEGAILSAAERGVRASAVRLPPSVHGRGDHGFVPALIEVARRTGVSAYIGDGANRWPTVNRFDAANLFVLALEQARPGARLHAVADEGVPMRAIAEAIGQHLRVPVRGIDPAEAQAHFDWLALFVGIDNPVSSAITRDTLGWHPSESGLIKDLNASGYFPESATA